MATDPDYLLVLTSAEIGASVADLGAQLTDLFLKSLASEGGFPAKIIFLNSAVFLTTEGSHVLESLGDLAEGGTELVSCITCLEYFNRRDRVAVGVEGNMQDTVHALAAYRKVVTM
jgi:hypothetical protein